jgi:hypothetical protein
MIEDKKWCTSLDGEHYSGDAFDTKEEAINDGKVGYGGDPFYVGQICEIKATQLLDIDWMLESMAERAQEEAGDAGEDYLCDVTKKQKEDLEKTLEKWFKKNKLNPCFYGIENEEEIK